MKSAAHAWPVRNVPFRIVPLLAMETVESMQSMAYLCFSFSHAISCGIVDSNRCAAPKSIT